MLRNRTRNLERDSKNNSKRYRREAQDFRLTSALSLDSRDLSSEELIEDVGLARFKRFTIRFINS